MIGKPLNIAAAKLSGITKNGMTVWWERPIPQTLRAPRNLRAHLGRSWDPRPQNMVAHRPQLQSLRADTIGGFGLSPLKKAGRRNRLNSVGMIRLSLKAVSECRFALYVATLRSRRVQFLTEMADRSDGIRRTGAGRLDE
jgi:hypothetical protein